MTNDHSPDNTAPVKRVLVCVNPIQGGRAQCCGRNGGEEIAAGLEEGVKARHLDVEVKRMICMGRCDRGPTVRLAPGQDFVLGKSPADVPELLDWLEAECGTKAADDDLGLLFPGA